MQEVQQDLWRFYECEVGCLLWLARKCRDKAVQRGLIATAAEYIAELVGTGRKVDPMVKGYEPIEASLRAVGVEPLVAIGLQLFCADSGHEIRWE